MSSGLPSLRRSGANILATWLLQLGVLLFAIVSVPLITRRFGLEGLGIWLLVQQVVGHLQLLELGIASNLGRYLSRAQALNLEKVYTQHFSSAIVILFAMGIVILLLSIPFGIFFPKLFNLPSKLAEDASWMIFFAILITGLSLPLRSAVGVFSSQHCFALQSVIEGAILLLRTILIATVCIIVGQHALIGLVLAVFLPSLLGGIVMFMIAKRKAPFSIFNIQAVGIKPIRDLLAISFAAMTVTVSAVLLRQGGPMLAGLSEGVESIPLIALPIMLVVSLSPFIGISNQLISPIASQLDAENKLLELRTIYLTTARYTLAVASLLFVLIWILAPLLLPVWLGREIVDDSQLKVINMNLILIFSGYCVAIPALLARSVLMSVGKHQIAAKGEFFSAIAGLGIGCVLMELMGLGVTGMAYGIAAAYLIRAGGILMHQLALYFEFSITSLFFEVWWRPCLTISPLLIVLSLYAADFFNNSLMVTLATLTLALWVWLLLKLIVTKQHKHRLFAAINRLIVSKENR